MAIINWVSKIQIYHILNNLFEDTQRILNDFDSFQYQHVYREHNTTTYKLSREGLILVHGQWKIMEHTNDTFQDLYRMPFVEGP